MIDRILDNLLPFAIFGFIGTISGLMILGIAGSMLAACWKVAWRVCKWVSRQLKSEPKKADLQSKPQSGPVETSNDTRPLSRVPNWQKDPAKLTGKTLMPMPETPTMPPIYF
jgi:hypothetical protein